MEHTLQLKSLWEEEPSGKYKLVEQGRTSAISACANK